MLKDITIGQYFPGKSLLHRLDPRMKLILTMTYLIMLFSVGNMSGFVVCVALLLWAVRISRIPLSMIIKGLKPILLLILITGAFNLFFVTTGDELISFGFFNITTDGVLVSIRMILRIVCLIMASSLLTYTTSPISLTDAIEHLLRPLEKIKFPAHEMAMMMSIALRFIPTLMEETDRIISAQKARGADMESGNLIRRARSLIPILIPLFVSAFRRADELALAMECRCYHGGEGRTRMKQLVYQRIDLYAVLLIIACWTLVIVLNMLMPPLTGG